MNHNQCPAITIQGYGSNSDCVRNSNDFLFNLKHSDTNRFWWQYKDCGLIFKIRLKFPSATKELHDFGRENKTVFIGDNVETTRHW